MQKVYSHLKGKNQVLLKSYAANFNRLLTQALSEDDASGVFVGNFFSNGEDVVKCCLPFSMYKKKLAISCAKVTVTYHKMHKATIFTAFSALRHLMVVVLKAYNKESTTFYESALRKMYNEFASVSRVAGGNFQV